MNLSPLLERLRDTSDYRALLAQVEHKRLNLNLLGAARPYLLAALQQDFAPPILLIAAKPDQALQWYRQLSSWSAEPDSVFHFAEPDTLPHERTSMSLDIRQKRLATLLRLWESG